MRASRMSTKSQWRNIGRRAAASGIPLERAATTKSETLNALIRDGYESEIARHARKSEGQPSPHPTLRFGFASPGIHDVHTVTAAVEEYLAGAIVSLTLNFFNKAGEQAEARIYFCQAATPFARDLAEAINETAARHGGSHQ